ncbi:MAG TPA: hypothetical protein PKD83_00215 [Ignavibacteria bacterium]|nr:hypothetical protein [Ignavibacteria bacterium]
MKSSIKTVKQINIIKKISAIIISFTAAVILSFQGCENNPNDVGINYIPATDTTGVRFLDSETDSMTITSNNYEYYINTVLATNLMIGNYQNYSSKALLKFYSLPSDYDSANVISAVLNLRYGDYSFQDKQGLTDFSVHRVVSNLNYNTITYDSVSASDFGIATVGSFSSVVQDSSSINVDLDPAFVKDWFEYAADTTYPVENYGMAFLPGLSSTTIKGFFVFNDNVSYVPTVTAIVTKNGVTDTIKLIASLGVTLSNAAPIIIPQDRFLLQNGIAYRNILNFDLSKLPPNVTINNATLQFTLDNANSYYSASSNKTVVIGMVTDSVLKKDSIFTNAFLLDTIVYSVSLNSVFQRWDSGLMPNLGITMKNASEIQNLNYFAFYSPSYTDPSKRPRLKITYTLRYQ